ncbi:Transposase, IS4-like domain protein [Candidatus Thiomargarita nelsonii]|uniref:Transposase, IS4-like domain protein n=1 Tax=Candidatus Thiomargarita nelsonii TaxID=1003181 RepID=A0A176S0F0_9GAMM|nr:Transposase, IS4-like domain protein [Candidatus Thiomargarita nelsonii]
MLVLRPSCAYEVDLALKHLEHTQANDLVIFDRNYTSYIFLAEDPSYRRDKLNRQFAGRCSRSSFKAAQQLFKQYVIDSKKATLTAKGEVKKQCKILGLDEQITVRFARIKLSTGETEVLVTSLLDSEQYTTQMLKELYHLRWGIETFLGVLKERLKIENFTGKTVIAIKPDFFATLFLTGLESILTQTADLYLFKKSSLNKLRQTVNNIVSFNAIKNFMIELFYHCSPIQDIMATLTEWFIKDPTYAKRERDV